MDRKNFRPETSLKTALLLLLSMNAVLSYSGLLFSAYGPILVVGEISLLLIFEKNRSWLETGVKPASGEFLPEISTRLLVFLFICAVSLRFFKLTTLRLWPIGDEALQGFLGLYLSQHWSWQFFYTVGQHPPLSVWTYAFFCKFFNSALSLFRTVPAVVSVLTAMAGYFAARQFFSKSFAFLFGCLMAFSFWPLFTGRFYLQFVPFFELMDLALMGLWLKCTDPAWKSRYSIFVGGWTGLGFFTYTSWMVVAVLMAGWFSWVALKDKKGRYLQDLICFWVSFLVTLCPFLCAAVTEGFGAHWGDVVFSNGQFPIPHKAAVFLSYWTSLFWGSLQTDVSYGPSWGGILNPLLATCFGLGLVIAFKTLKKTEFLFFSATFVLLMAPGLATADYPCMDRVIQVMPLLLLVAAIGLKQVLEMVHPISRRWAFLGFFLIPSFGLDFYHLVKPNLIAAPFPHFEFKNKADDPNFEAYEVLLQESRKKGPGLIFSDFLLLSRNHSLTVATYGFNGCLNPRIAPQNCHWAAVITNIHYQPYLNRRFPDSSWHRLGLGPEDTDGGLVVGIFPVDPKNGEVFSRWKTAHDYFHNLNFEAENILNSPVLYRHAVEELAGGYALMGNDPYLESCYGEWVAQYHQGADLSPNIQAIQRALRKGYPAANLYYKLGNFLFLNRQSEQARKAYLMAVKCEPNYTSAQEILSRIWEQRP